MFEESFYIWQSMSDVSSVSMKENNRGALLRLRLWDEICMEFSWIQTFDKNIFKW